MPDVKVDFITHQPAFQNILGDKPRARLLLEASGGDALYHEACIYHKKSRSVFVTSNQLPSPTSRFGKCVKLFRIHVDEPRALDSEKLKAKDVTPSELKWSSLNGGVNYGDDAILMCAQGSPEEHLSGLITISTDANNPKVEPILESFHGIPFNSVNDVVVHPTDKTIWFTDPCYGYHQGIRGKPQLPNQVYCFDPRTKSIRAVADGFVRPNGICFSPDAKKVYVTDTGAIHGSAEVPIDPSGPSSIYVFDLVGGQLVNKRLFAFAPGRFPDGIKCDIEGNVYTGCGDGIEVWNEAGTLLGVIIIPGGVANFCFGESGTLYACNESRFWEISLDGEGIKGALLGL